MGKVANKIGTLRIGLTGGIASGKTLVAAMFEVCGAKVAFADVMAKAIMQQDKSVVKALKALLGDDIYTLEQHLDRQRLAGLIFADEALLAQVNAIVHPAVRSAAMLWHEKIGLSAPYTIYESALLFESGAATDFDLVVTVHAPRPMRLERACLRDNADRSAIEARMDAQLSDHERLDRDSYVILNDGSESLVQQVVKLHRIIIARSA